MASKRSRVHPKYKTKYHVTNWPAYDRSLVQRGDVTVWMSPAALADWNAKPTGQRGGQQKYSDLAIETAITLRLVFHLPLRQAEGFLGSLFKIMDVDLDVPDHTTLSRRLRKLVQVRVRRLARHRPFHLLIDSTGLRIHVAHLQKPPRNRAWRKLHLAVDADTG